MPLLTTAQPKDQKEPELPWTMIVIIQQLMSQQHFHPSPSAHLKMNVKMIMCSWGE